MRLRPFCFATASVIAITVAFAPVARADSGSAEDPRDTSGPLDIARVSHTNDRSKITYRVEMYESLRLEDIYLVRWDFDLDNDGTPSQACVIVTRLGSTRTLRGGFFGDCGPETWATADARIVDGNAMEITFPIIDLVEGGGLPPGADYGYRVTTKDRAGVEDTAPRGESLARHVGVPSVEPREGSADTQFGYPGQRARSGNPGRPQRSANELAESGGAGGSEAGSDGFLSSVPVIGNLCSGSSCFLIALGVPIVAALLGWAGLLAYRARRRPQTGPSTPIDVEDSPRSHAGHVRFAPSSETADTVRSVPGSGVGTGCQETERGP